MSVWAWAVRRLLAVGCYSLRGDLMDLCNFGIALVVYDGIYAYS